MDRPTRCGAYRLTVTVCTLLAAFALAATVTSTARAAALTAELQKQVRAATFEVVIRKPTKDLVTYEKPLPLELIPFTERNDAYWPVGTAFAIGPNTFVTAAHVLVAGVGSQFGVPGIRDPDGKVYTVDRVQKFALHEDFVVFTVSGTPTVTPFVVSTAVAIDDTVFAVGNALGEGVVIRDGLLTSLTPEAQDGKWKWLRFSAAASPGNSGGPLLDAQGRVVGVVTAKSPNENLNYALPIEQVMKGSDTAAVFDKRESFGIGKILQGTVVGEFQDSFPLPLPYPDFARDFRAALLKYMRSAQAKLVAAEADNLFPHSAAKLLATVYESPEPTLVTQDEDRSWDAHSCSNGSSTPLAGDGSVWRCADNPEAGIFRIIYPGSAVDEHRYHDSRDFMDVLLKGVNVPRMIGPQPVRITSLGAAQQESLLHDHFGRVWQQRIWSLGYADAYVAVLALPTPDGYVGLMSVMPSTLLDPVSERLKFIADYMYLSYSGSLPQWHAFLERRELRPAVFDHITLQYENGKGVHFDTPRLHLDTTGIVTAGAQSAMDLRMTYMTDRGRLTWDVGGVLVREDRDKQTFVSLSRQAKPADDAGKERRERWQHMTQRDGDFTGVATHDDQYTNFWIRTVAGGEHPAPAGAESAAPPLYEVVYNTDNKILPRQMEDVRATLVKDLRVTE
jgi:serine protease Do